LAGVLEVLFEEGRRLDRGKPTPRKADRLNEERKKKLTQLCEWRNAIVHGDISRKRTAGRLVPSGLSLKTCRDWRRSVGALARSIDRVLAIRLQTFGCLEPW
jgi:hypothetical protein